MRVYYFVHLTGRDTGNSGIQRVVRSLARALLTLRSVEIIPVRWCAERMTLVHAERIFLETLELHNGPRFPVGTRAGEPICPFDRAEDEAPEWLLVPEVPHLLSHDAAYPSLAIVHPLASARGLGLRTAVILHDILPLTHPEQNASDAVERLKFTVYAQGLINADVIMPVSRSTGALFADWLADCGYRPSSRPRFATVELPEEIAGLPRLPPDTQGTDGRDGDIAFAMVGTICSRKNQLAAMEAFNRVIRRRPDLPLFLHLVGLTDPGLVADVARQVRWAGGRIHNHGFIEDTDLVRLVSRARATIFVSLAEGYGLPVAESLWLGTPCLCSNIEPMADIAAGGGCLTVEPTDIDAIAAAIERLASDEETYRTLLAGLTARAFRTWRDYASAVVEAFKTDRHTDLAGIPVRPPLPVPAPTSPPSAIAAREKPMDRGSKSAPAAETVAGEPGHTAVDRQFTIDAAALACHEAYGLGGANSLRTDGPIQFEASRHGSIAEPVLFHGPYLTVEPGVYLFAFEGELDGTITIRFTHDMGKPIKQLAIDSFAPFICLTLSRRLDKFEIVGLKTPALRHLNLRSVSVRHIDPTADAGKEGASLRG